MTSETIVVLFYNGLLYIDVYKINVKCFFLFIYTLYFFTVLKYGMAIFSTKIAFPIPWVQLKQSIIQHWVLTHFPLHSQTKSVYLELSVISQKWIYYIWRSTLKELLSSWRKRKKEYDFLSYVILKTYYPSKKENEEFMYPV